MQPSQILKEGDDDPPSQLLEWPCSDTTGVVTLKKETIFNKFWPDATSKQWNDWRWQMANRLRSLQTLSSLLNLKPYQVSAFKKLLEVFHYSATPYYLSLIDWSDPEDPIRKQAIPDLQEASFEVVGNMDPLEEEEDMPVPNLVHRYPDRVLAIITNTCAMYCRHCTRKRIWHEGESAMSRQNLEAMVAYVKSTPKIREVVVSGGDPLTSNIENLDWFLGELKRISHVDVLRIGTRVPVVLPMRITEDLVKMLGSHRPLWLNTQFNHPREITPEAQEACDKIQRVGIPVSNQSVLLKGINDSVETMKELNQSLQKIMVRPYYLYQCDPVRGVEHFRTSIWKGIEIMEMFRGFTGGLCIPSFVVDAPGGGGKIPLQPFYLLSASDKEVLLRNYEGMIVKYYNPQENGNGKPKKVNGNGRNVGQPSLLKDNAKVLAPQNTPRFARRRKKNMRNCMDQQAFSFCKDN
jgi:lysine 2,3-aminomutase